MKKPVKKPDRFAAFVLRLLLCALPAAVRADGISAWYGRFSGAATGTACAVGNSVVAQRGTETVGPWAEFPPVPISPGGSVTVTFTVKPGAPLSADSDTQLRVALVSTADGDPPVLASMRGFVLCGGLEKQKWITRLWERISPPQFPASARGSANLAKNVAAENWPRPDSFRVVMTVTKKAAKEFDVTGFWGGETFSFRAVKTENDYANFCAVGFINGDGTGCDRIEFNKVRVTGN